MESTERVVWTDVLEQFRKDCGDGKTALVEYQKTLLQPFHDQLSSYANEMCKRKEESTLSSTDMKDLVVQTRAALRFGLACVTPPDDETESNHSLISELQDLAVVQGLWAVPLSQLLCQLRGDPKCRLLSARLLCNLITSNAKTASILASTFPLSPSAESVNMNIQQSLITNQNQEDNNHDSTTEPNWVDMIVAAGKSKNRDALAALVAALHNMIVALTNTSFADNVAHDSMLLSVLLRYFVSAESVVESLKLRTQHDAAETHETNTEADNWDSATDWIHLLLAKLAKLGWLPLLYRSVGSCSVNIPVLPEQNVLLHCMAREADSFVMGCSSNTEISNPFGGDGGLEETIESYVFLATLATELSSIIQHKKPATIVGSTDESFENSLIESGYVTVLDILRSTLGVDDAVTGVIRQNLGKQTSLVQECAKYLGNITDMLAEQVSEKRARDVRLTATEQHLLTSLVCLIGNMCHKSKQNQDLLRLTVVPPKLDIKSNDRTNSGEARNGLHTLLSCTAYATSCFTLREWGVIAIRNALEANLENQAVVAELVAQDPVQSADLEHAGIRVTLDVKGQVSLSKIDADKE
ncbi:hypothetical protein IV203_019365 [Nitzschia inconspicua]|uniref:Ataxin-10 domain-containing protein n=1 Tax=Nitzschia inconspicua TaxID=303405 RepID=A0A9K3Q585_9STRA|nr:hypothetical protein IV203_019365 [Nitzschia inconspicua]